MLHKVSHKRAAAGQELQVEQTLGSLANTSSKGKHFVVVTAYPIKLARP